MVLGGKYVTRVVAAVPGVAPEGAVPPEMGSPSDADHVVVSVSLVALAMAALTLAAICMKLAV